LTHHPLIYVGDKVMAEPRGWNVTTWN